jgi:ribonuclease P protein component
MSGHKKTFFPLKVFVLPIAENGTHPLKMMVSVPKRNIKSAVKRNRIKRLIRECWRLNKQSLYQSLETEKFKGNVMLMFIDKEMPVKIDIDSKIQSMFTFILSSLRKSEKSD